MSLESHQVDRAKPFLRWAGSKRSSIGRLAHNVPSRFNAYYEPFVGSGALFFHLCPTTAIISDLNRDLINLYHAVRDFPEEIYGELNKIPRERESYNKIREAIIRSDNLFERAVFTLYLNRNCFNGLYRTNKSGHFNVPFAAAGRGGYPSLSDFISASNQLKMANIICSDFESVIKERLSKEDFVYLDPPYIKNEGRIFNEYVKGHFNKGDMDRLSDVLNFINSRGAYFLLSFIDDEAVYSLAEQWGAERYMVQKNISGFAASRRKSSEVIIKNW